MNQPNRIATSLIVRTIALVGILIASTAVARAHDDHPEKVLDKDLYRPTRMPDRIVLTFQTDPARSQAVTWRTDTSVTKGLAQIARAQPDASFVNQARDCVATTTLLKAELGDAHYHTVNFVDLAPSAKYVYRVGDGANWSEWFQFRTASDRPEPFSFVYFGDAQNDIRSLWSRVIREAHSDAPKARFLLHAGDLINTGNSDAQWGEWFGAGSWLNAMVPNVPSPGNHEYPAVKAADGRVLSRGLSVHWRPQFALPENGPKGLAECTYWFDYQGARIVSLDSNEQVEAQAVWLDKLLSDNPNAWTIVTFHHPIYSTGINRDNPGLRKAWKPVFDKHRVDLVLNGHDHSYGRTGLDVPENVTTGINTRNPQTGTVYVVSVSGPKMYKLGQVEYMKRVGENTQLYQVIRIAGDTLTYEAHMATGRLYDGFLLKKRRGEINELVDKIPDLPKRRQPQKQPAAVGR